MRDLVLLPIGSDPVVRFAAAELARYLERLACSPVTIRPMPASGDETEGLWLGVADDLPDAPLPAVSDARWDDSICGRVNDGVGVLCGSNPRSVLIAAYRYLAELGCRWVRPGADGEHLPSAPVGDLSAGFAEAASYRHRGVCIEGAVSLEHVRDMVAWLPKVAMNAYFVQFREGYTFFDRWYSQHPEAGQAPDTFRIERARELAAQVARDAAQRGLIYHAVGHGWTCEPFGVAGLGWDYDQGPAPPAFQPYLAQLAGVRGYAPGGPLNTNLCYSNGEVRRIIADDVARYAAEHPEVDALHLWLADGSNNQCECEPCRALRPSDWYVALLNKVDERLSRAGLETRVVFLVYVDLLWPPEKERLRNPDRFILMFAPITRSYSHAFAPTAAGAVADYERNRLSFPRSVDDNVAYLRAWQQQCGGDGFDFDYHLMWDHYNDPGTMQIARVLHEDIGRLADIGLNGLVSCQTQRASLPTGLPMAILARTLWDRAAHFDEVEAGYMAAAFGEAADGARTYLQRLTALFDPAWLRGDGGSAEDAAERLGRVPALVAEALPMIEANACLQDACHAASWRYLRHHADLVVPLAGALAARARGDSQGARRAWERVRSLASEREETLHPVLDVWLLQQTLGPRFEKP